MNKYAWYYHRLRAMSLAEVAFRARQFARKQTDKKQVGWQPDLLVTHLPKAVLPFDPAHAPAVAFGTKLHVFEHELDFGQPIDWHLDISTNRRFPLHYAKSIDIRSGQFGSAKYVWEVNRLHFLPQVAVQFCTTGDRRFLDQFVGLVDSWIEANPYLLGVNWYSNIEVNIRLLNWFLCWNILDVKTLSEEDAAFRSFVENCWLPSIYQHAVYSHGNPSYHSSANNHLISEYAGLFVTSAFWKFPESNEWRAFAKAGLEREILAQHSSNGINREEAAEYIQFITDFFLLAYVVGEATANPFSRAYAERLKAIFKYIAQFLDASGHFPQYGDEDDGRVWLLDDRQPFNNFRSLLASGAVLFGEPLFKQRSQGFDLKNYALFGAKGQRQFDAVPESQALLPSAFFQEEGHFIFRKQQPGGREIYLHFDAAPLGFLSIAAHGHADALSFLMGLDGQLIFTDPGTFTYHTEPAWRRYFVSTRAHNTVCLDGQNQAFQAGGLLWLDHYTPTVHKANSDTTRDEVIASHNGYERLGCQHQRRVIFDKKEDRFELADRLVNDQDSARTVDVTFHLHPEVRIEALGHNQFRLNRPNGQRHVHLHIDPLLTVEVVRGRAEPEILGWYSPGFYRKQPAPVLRAFGTLPGKQTMELQHRIEIKS